MGDTRLSQAWSMLKWSLEQRGVVGTLRVAVDKLTRKRTEDPVPAFDLRYGVDTAGFIGGGRLATGSADDVHNASYHGIAPSRFVAIVSQWQQMLQGAKLEEYTFVDLGCGKGRAVLMASEYSFRQVVGVELNPSLKQTAEANLMSWRQMGKAVSPVTLVLGNVTEYSFPTGPCVIYMYNPFAAPVMARVIASIEKQFSAGRLLDVLYFNPVEAHLFEEHSSFTLLRAAVLPLSEEDRATDIASSSDELFCIYRYKA